MPAIKELETTSHDPSTRLGSTTIADGVVARIAGLAAREIPGVHALSSGGIGGTIADIAVKMTRGDNRGMGVDVEVGQKQAAVDLRVTVDYGVNIPSVAEAVRKNVVLRVQKMTGLEVKEVNVQVTDLYFSDDEKQPEPSRVQ